LLAMTDDELLARRRAATEQCTRWLFFRGATAPEQLRSVADAAVEDEPDRYGGGGEVALLEQEVADLLGKPAAAFLPSGVMAQQCVLRTYADDAATARVALHGLSHFLKHELNALPEVHGLRVEVLTDEPRQPVPDDLAAIPGKLAAVSVELPLRDAGYLLPGWDELMAFSRACADRGVPLHLDGARLWESTPYLGHGPAEVSALASSVYVSFYKGLGGLAGAAVAGPEALIAGARRWQTRLGGTLFMLAPYAVAARQGLRTLLPRMGEFQQRAVELASALTTAGFRVYPDPPHTNSFRIFAESDPEQIEARAVRRMEETKESISPRWIPADVPGWSWTELVVGAGTMDWTVPEAVSALSDLLATRRGP
jgi:threonine aldolase